ncbi:MAG TPA: hypothetical protein VHS99_00370 [Chloroflexota bacterium]|nr:hypothetical protein [Chloroflexota bacterium]
MLASERAASPNAGSHPGRPDAGQPSWPERIADALRRIFYPGVQRPRPVPVPVPVGGPRLRSRLP